MKLSCSAYQTGSGSYAQKILSGHGHSNYGATSSSANTTGESTQGLIMPSWKVEEIEGKGSPNDNSESPNEGSSSYGGGGAAKGHESRSGGHDEASRHTSISSHSDGNQPERQSDSTSKTTHDSSRSPSESPAHHHHRDRIGLENRSRSKSVGEQQWTNLRTIMRWYSSLRRIRRSKSNQRWMKLRTTVQLSGAISSTIQKKTTLKREDSFLKRFSTRQVPEAQETFEIGEDDASGSGGNAQNKYRRKKKRSLPRSVVNPDGNFYFYWLFLLTVCVLYNLWTLIVRESFPELQSEFHIFWIVADAFTDVVILLDLAVQMRTCYLEQGLMVYKTKKLAVHYIGSKNFWFDLTALLPTDLLQFYLGIHPMLRVPRFLKTYRMYSYYYMVESRTVYPNVWRVVNLIHVLLLLAHWFGCFYYLLSEAENFAGQWVYPDPVRDPSYAPLTRKYLASLYWSTLTLTTIGDLPTPYSNWQYLFTIVSYLIGVFIFATIVGQVGNVITNRNANRLEFERLLDGAKMYMRHHRVPRDMQRRVLRWYDYSWSRGRIQGGGDINTALGLLPDKLKTELALHVNLSVLKKVTIFQECQPEFLHDLVLKMKAYIFTPGDLICRKGEVAREMFIIADGILEVISETGRVLTTMQAGDFFGEIGILNLDGLNKRTADVRSVGYSELFSLSREDVLAAMKDYPEAQEILQTLGRKRLMEARKANAPYVKKAAEKKSPLHLLGHSMAKCIDDVPGDSTGKKIVEKLRSDVKGLRNAIRKSRKSNSSKEDSSEPESAKEKYEAGLAGVRRKESTISVQQYYGGGRMSIVGSMLPSSSASRGVLKRMHNIVLSDEKEKVGIGGDTSMSNRSPTILPKRVQVQLPTQESVAPREVIGAGLPLIQRLRLLRQKEESERKQKLDEEKAAAEKETSTFQTKVSVEPPPKVEKRGRAGSEPSAVPTTARLSPTRAIPGATTGALRLTAESRGTSNESNTSVVSEQAAVAGLESPAPDTTDSREPRPSALRFQKRDAKTYGSVDDLSPEFSRLPFIKKLQILNERQKIAELLTNKPANPVVLTRSTSEGSSEIPATLPVDSENLYSVVMGRRTQSHSEEFRKNLSNVPRRGDVPPFPLPLPSPSSSSPSPSDDESKKKKLREASAPERLIKPAQKSPQVSPPMSPEWNETPERRHLKSILKTLSKSAESGEEESEAKSTTEEAQPPVEDYQLLRAPTLEGYAARHRKFAKNVTFQRQAVTVVSPDGEALFGVETRVTQTTEVEVPEHPAETETGPKPETRLTDEVDVEEVKPDLDSSTLSSAPFSITAEALKKARIAELSLLALRQGNGTEGIDLGNIGLNLGRAVAQEECIGGVFLGIKNIIQAKMDEMQLKFQDRFTTLETEVRQRDEIIGLLQLRIQELEDKGLGPPGSFLRSTLHSPPSFARHGQTRLLENHRGDGYDEDDEDEDEHDALRRAHQSSYLFSRGDSIDTVIDNTEEYGDDEVFASPHEDHAHLASALLQADTTAWTVAERESIEMSDLGTTDIPLWQLEFHREPEPQPDSVALDIGNTSTEYESSSSSEGERTSKETVPSRVLQEIPVPLDESDEEEESEEEEEADESMDEFDNQNWEVQMLAREMDKLEHQKEQMIMDEDVEGLVVDEMLELDSEFQEMRDVVSSGALSPTELDMLESVLENRTRRVRALSKAFSTEVPTSSGSRLGGRISEEFRPRGSSLQYQYTKPPLSNIHAVMASAARRSSRQLSPSETQPRKRSNIKRQASLCETGPSQQPSFATSKAAQRRRESAGSLGKSFKSGTSPTTPETSKASILSKIPFIRSLSRAFLHTPKPEETSAGPSQSSSERTGPEKFTPVTSAPVPIPMAGPSSSSNLSRKSSSSTGILPIVSASILPSSVQSDPGGRTASHPLSTTPLESSASTSIFTIPPPSTPGPSGGATDKSHGETQPLLKK